MKSIHRTQIVGVALGIVLGITGCKSTVRSTDRDGHFGFEAVIGTRIGDFTVPEEERVVTKDGVTYGKWHDVHFGYNRTVICQRNRSNLEEIAIWAQGHPDRQLMVAGHCDERGRRGYNQSLGEHRALAVREYLIQLGVPAPMIGTRSYGEERPINPCHNPVAWRENRRAEIGIVKSPPVASQPTYNQ